MSEDVNNDSSSSKVDEKKIVVEFCQLQEKSRQLFNALRDLPQFGHKHWQTHFGKTFDVYTRLWKFQQKQRSILDSKYNLKRWQIGEIASKIGQLYYHYYLRTSEANYLRESFAFYSAIRSRAYYSQASKEEKSDLMVKKLRYYARFIVVSLLLNKIDLVKELIQELYHYVEEYVSVYEADDDEEWRLVISEVTAFMEEIPPQRPVGPTSLSLQEILIVGTCEKQVKFSELTLDMFRMLQALEREPEAAPSRTLVTSTEVSESIDDRNVKDRFCLKFEQYVRKLFTENLLTVRINLGGAHATWYMQRLLQLKHPHHTQQITLSRAQELVHGYTSMAIDYSNELEKWASTDYYDDHVNKIQLPYAQVQAPQNSGTKNEEKEKMRRQKQGRRLQEINARRREEKLAEEEERLQDLMNIQALELENKNEFQRSFTEAGFQNAEALQAAIKNLTASIRKRKEKIVAMQTALELDSEVKEKDDIIDVVSDQPISESKKRQRTPKGAAEDKSGKKLKEDKKQSQQKSHEELQREETFKSWLTGLHKRRKEILDARQQRAQRREDLASRRSHASLERMRLLSQLAYDPNVRDDGTTRITNKKPKEDTFGQNDEDWMVYRSINKDAGDSDSEKEQEELNELENLLKKHDPDFSKRFGGKPETAVDWVEYYQLHLGVERIRVPEIVYQPSMLGIEQAGIAETIDFILNHFPAELQTALVQNIFVTGGNTQFPKFQERLERELLAIRPFQSTFRVTTAANPALDAWCGARKWARSMSGNLKTVSVTREEYEEKGGEYLKEHFASNLYVPTPSLT